MRRAAKPWARWLQMAPQFMHWIMFSRVHSQMKSLEEAKYITDISRSFHQKLLFLSVSIRLYFVVPVQFLIVAQIRRVFFTNGARAPIRPRLWSDGSQRCDLHPTKPMSQLTGNHFSTRLLGRAVDVSIAQVIKSAKGYFSVADRLTRLLSLRYSSLPLTEPALWPSSHYVTTRREPIN